MLSWVKFMTETFICSVEADWASCDLEGGTNWFLQAVSRFETFTIGALGEGETREVVFEAAWEGGLLFM
jgi:hypothetical protein